MTSVIQDLRYGLRSLVKSPGFTAVAVLTLALGVGANAAIFSVLRAVVLRDLPYHDADRIAVLWTKNIRQNLPDGSSYLNFRDWKEQSKTFEQMAAYIRPEFTRGTLSGGPGAERIQIGQVGPGFFELLGTAPLLGRMFEAGDFTAATRTVIISHGLWRQRFGADRDVIGRSIQFSDMTVEIVGVMPPGFELPTADVQLWQPLVLRPAAGRTSGAAARTRSSCSAGCARPRRSRRRARRWTRLPLVCAISIPRSNASFGVSTDPLTDRVIGQTTERSLWLLFGSVGFVLLIACANVTNLVLARAARAPQRVLAANRARREQNPAGPSGADGEPRPVAAGGNGRACCSRGAAPWRLRRLAPGALPRAETIAVDATVLLFLLAASLASGLVAGLLPALQLSTARPADVLREDGPRALGGRGARRAASGTGRRRDRARRHAALGRRAPHAQLPARPGDQPGIRFHATCCCCRSTCREPTTTRRRSGAFYTEATRRLRSLPGVVAVGAIGDFFIHRQPDYRVALEGQPPQREEDPAPPLTEDQVIPGFFEAMRIPLLRGRLLQESDLAPGAPQVIVINEEMARRFWPNQDPLGKRLKYGLDPGAKNPWKTVVGVVADMRRQRLDEPAIPYMFQPGITREMDIAVRTLGDPDSLREAIRAEMRALDPTVPPYGIVTVEQRLGRTVALRRLQTLLLDRAGGGRAGPRRDRRLRRHPSVRRGEDAGDRRADGARRERRCRAADWCSTAGLIPAAAGLALGLLGSLMLSRTLSTFLYETNALDPLIYAAVTFTLLAVTTLACLAPALRAARLDPMRGAPPRVTPAVERNCTPQAAIVVTRNQRSVSSVLSVARAVSVTCGSERHARPHGRRLRWCGTNRQKLNARRDRRRKRDRHLQRTALAAHRPLTAERVLDDVELRRRGAGADLRAEIVNLFAPPVLRPVHEQVLGGDLVGQRVVPAQRRASTRRRAPR